MHAPPRYSLPQLMARVIWSPVTAVHTVLLSPYPLCYPLALMAMGFVFVSGFALAIISQMYVLSAKTVLFGCKIGLTALLFLLVLGLLVYLVKKIFTASSFRQDLMVGGLAGLALTVQTILLLVVLLLFKDSLITTFVDGPVTFTPQIAVLFFVLLYGVLFMLNVVQQSFAVSGISTSSSWYLAPAVAVAAVYISTSVGGWLIAE